MKRISIVDIATELGVSASTVSRALQDHPDISKDTKRMVQEYARVHHYRPNTIASNLRRSRSTTIGLLLPTITNYAFSTVLAGIEQIAAEEGYQVVICQSDESMGKEIQQVHTLLASRVAGIIACPSHETTSFGHLQEVMDTDTPLVIAGRQCDLPCHQVIADEYLSAFQATEYLVQTGCRHIALYSGIQNVSTNAPHMRGYIDALTRYNIPIDNALIMTCHTRKDAVAKTPLFLKAHPEVDAVLTSNDQTAAGVLRSTKLMGIRVPEDLQICGCGNDAITRYADPLISTIDQHALEIGRTSMQRMIECLGDNPPAPVTTTITTNLLLRETTK